MEANDEFFSIPDDLALDPDPDRCMRAVVTDLRAIPT
jgi:hypothetical protein